MGWVYVSHTTMQEFSNRLLGKIGVVHYINSLNFSWDKAMTMPEEFTVPQAAAYLLI